MTGSFMPGLPEQALAHTAQVRKTNRFRVASHIRNDVFNRTHATIVSLLISSSNTFRTPVDQSSRDCIIRFRTTACRFGRRSGLISMMEALFIQSTILSFQLVGRAPFIPLVNGLVTSYRRQSNCELLRVVCIGWLAGSQNFILLFPHLNQPLKPLIKSRQSETSILAFIMECYHRFHKCPVFLKEFEVRTHRCNARTVPIKDDQRAVGSSAEIPKVQVPIGQDAGDFGNVLPSGKFRNEFV